MPSIASAFGIETRLRRLIAHGFHFLHPRDHHGEILTVVGVRAHDDVIDVIRLHTEDDVVATRMPGHENDVLEPNQVLWRSTGCLREVVDDLLALPDDPCAAASGAASCL